MTSMAKAKSKKGATPKQLLPELIFGRPRAESTLPVLKNILAVFKQELVKHQRRTTLLKRLTVLEQNRSPAEKSVVTHLLRRGAPLTREGIDIFSQALEEPKDEEIPDTRPDRACVACLDILPATAFRKSKVTPTYKHE